MTITQTPITRTQVFDALKKNTRFIAPLWSLENFVAVNVYQGMANMPFTDAMNFLNKCAGTAGTLPVSFYMGQLKKGTISKRDLAEALKNNDVGISMEVDDFLVDLYKEMERNSTPVRTLADIASMMSGKKWEKFMIDRTSFWAAAYFDKQQALWDTAQENGNIFTAWKKEAEVDLGPEVMGLPEFRNFLRSMPDHYLDAAALALDKLGISDEMMEYYINSLLMRLNGWAGFAARIDWDAGLHQKESNALQEFLTILLVWEMAMKELLPYTELDVAWDHAKKEIARTMKSQTIDRDLANRLILQQAFDLASQRKIVQKLNSQQQSELCPIKKTPKYQMVFCIDVRSEVLRRNIESVNNEIETLGFAGFFGFPIEYVPLGHDEGTNQCPVLLKPSYTIREQLWDQKTEQKAIARRGWKMQLKKGIKAFKKGAVSCFGFVSPLGIYFLPKLLSDTFGWSRPVPRPEGHNLKANEKAQKIVKLSSHIDEEPKGITLEHGVKIGLSALKAMSLTDHFAPVVVMTGHGSNTTNNPHAAGLDCGACGGHSGEANAKIAAAVLNDPKVRRALVKEGIEIPDQTLFVAGLHDTTTDQVIFFNAPSLYRSEVHNEYLLDLSHAMSLAGQKSRLERASRMNFKEGDIHSQILDRSMDWSQVRPEWGLAGCSSFIVAPRERTAKVNLEGKAFMHNYSWRSDEGFKILELIMTAPMVVTSWINLQYYASTVDNKVFGAGNKALHNVVGGIGVLEGFGGDLKVGLPIQSVHDGKKFQHDPVRLNVIIEAPVDEISRILEKYESIRQLVDNLWIYLFAMNDEGKVAYKYDCELHWEVI